MDTFQNRLQKLDLEPIKIKLTMDYEHGGFKWPADAADEAIDGYLDFLKTIYAHFATDDTNAEKPSPDPVVDIVWHTHILFTMKYHDDCDYLFGHYLHHQPNIEQ